MKSKTFVVGSGKFIVGNSLTWADLALVNGWEWLDDISKQLVLSYSIIRNHNEFIKSLPKVSQWFKSQKPLTVFKRV
jgi:glutathione S-transferase